MDLIIFKKEEFEAIVEKIDRICGLLEGTAINKETSKEWLSGNEVTNLLKVSSRTLQNYRDRGIIGFSKVGKKKILYKRADVFSLLDSYFINKS